MPEEDQIHYEAYTGGVIPRAFLVRLAPWWVLFVIIGSFLPGASKDALGTSNPPEVAGLGHAALKHRAAHFLTFGSTALLLVIISETTTQQLWAGLGVALLGLLLECSQYALLGLESIEWWDVRDDTIAAIGALILAQWLNLREKLVDTRPRREVGNSG
jgi:hypothetical protein